MSEERREGTKDPRIQDRLSDLNFLGSESLFSRTLLYTFRHKPLLSLRTKFKWSP